MVLSQKANLARLGRLMEVSEKHELRVHKVFERLAAKCGAEYHAGPLKDSKRVSQKAEKDYGGDVRKVVDVVRGLAVFTSAARFIASDSMRVSSKSRLTACSTAGAGGGEAIAMEF